MLIFKLNFAFLCDCSRFFTKKKCQILDFCRHLRNSFSHGLLKKENNIIIIPDINRNYYSSKGFLEQRREGFDRELSFKVENSSVALCITSGYGSFHLFPSAAGGHG